jgi:tryptophan synthase alpha chain
MVGENGLEDSLKHMDYYVNKGCKIIEIGLAFSDPSADGPIIQNAAKKAIANGINIHTCLEFTSICKKRYPDVILILMTYLNPLYAYGLEKIFSCPHIDGLIIPDLPFEAYNLVKSYVDESHIALIPLIGLDSTPERIKSILTSTSGFIYLMAVKGTTGSKEARQYELEQQVQKIASISSLPIVAGFGIKTIDQVQSLLKTTQGVVMASQLIEHWNNNDLVQIDHIFNKVR